MKAQGRIWLTLTAQTEPGIDDAMDRAVNALHGIVGVDVFDTETDEPQEDES